MFYRKKKKKEKPLPLFDKAGVKVKKKINYIDKLDKIFSMYIRVRDAMPNGFFKCISCGKIKPFDQADCGHYHSRRHMSVRYDDMNAHAECRACNRFSADHLIGYREHLIEKIGEAAYDMLSFRASQTKKWSDFELKELCKYYKALTEKIKKEKGL